MVSFEEKGGCIVMTPRPPGKASGVRCHNLRCHDTSDTSLSGVSESVLTPSDTSDTSTTFALVVRSLPEWPTAPLMRLRALLKRMRRDWGLSCIEVKPIRAVKESSEQQAFTYMRRG